MGSLLEPNARVLSTLNADGTRRWLDPMDVKGPLRHARRLLGYFLIALFVVLPHLHLNGRQLFLLDVAGGEFTFFGITLLRTDTVLFALSALTVFVTVFLLTALLGRVWCGWGCPQTVYLEFVFRPIARLFNGKGRKGVHGLLSGLPAPVRQVIRWALVVGLSFALANTFLAYFVGSRPLLEWITQPPWVHPIGFGLVIAVTIAMVFDFGFFREQLCLIACPYGRFQSVLLDRNSLIVGYDERRGEPRGKKRRRPSGDVSLNVIKTEEPGDCVDCHKCVAVCPTGIDIRDGLQMECIHCTRCIDACNGVMAKLGRAPGLIRYSSQNALEQGRSRFWRPRVIIYPLILALLLTGISLLATTKPELDVRLLRAEGAPFNLLDDGRITNQARIRLTNRSDAPRTYRLVAVTAGLTLENASAMTLEPSETASDRLLLVVPEGFFEGYAGRRWVTLRVIAEPDREPTDVRHRLLGPSGGTPGAGSGGSGGSP